MKSTYPKGLTAMFKDNRFNPHTFTLVRSPNGETVENIRGQFVPPSKVIIRDLSLGISVGDTLIQHLPGNQKKTLVITDVTPFDYKTGPLGSWYELRVESEHARRATAPVTFNIENSGQISQIGQTNIMNLDYDPAVFDEIRLALTKCAAAQENLNEILKVLSELEKEKDHRSQSFKQKFADFALLGSNIMTMLAPFIPRLL